MRQLSVLIVFALIFVAAFQIQATEKESTPVTSSYGEVQGQPAPETFRIIILGTRSGPDIELIRKNVEKLPYVSLFVPSSVSQRHLEFEGKFTGEEDTLVADVESLSQDRYEVKSKRDSKRGLVITLRKIQPVESTAE